MFQVLLAEMVYPLRNAVNVEGPLSSSTRRIVLEARVLDGASRSYCQVMDRSWAPRAFSSTHDLMHVLWTRRASPEG